MSFSSTQVLSRWRGSSGGRGLSRGRVSARGTALISLAAAGALWGATVPLSKLALGWLDPEWLTLGRFLIAALVLGVVARRQLRAALSWDVALLGAVGFGASVVLQNLGIDHTSVSHAAVLMGVAPALVAVAAVLAGHGHASRREWLSYGLSLAGIGLVAAGGGGGASIGGDVLVLASVALTAVLIALQPRLLSGRDPAAVTAVQFGGGALFALPVALLSGHAPALPGSAGAIGSVGPELGFLALALAGTVLPFWLFAHAQAQVRPQLAGAFVNLEPVVGAAIGWVFFADPFGAGSLLGALAVVAGIALAASSRRLGLAEAWLRTWRHSVDVQAALLQPPWERDRALAWERDRALAASRPLLD